MQSIRFILGAAILSLGACASVPALSDGGEVVAGRISSTAVAYNRAYGRAIADQVLLNVLRARDRLPLYHLSMSGITENSELAVQRTMGIGSIPLGDGSTPWGIGAVQGQRTATTKPTFVLNPFSSDAEHPRARQFEPLSYEVLRHFWDNDWPREILLLVLVDDLTPLDRRGRPVQGRRLENNSSDYRGDCQPQPATAATSAALRERCGFLWTIQGFNERRLVVTPEQGQRCTDLPSLGEHAPARRRCNVILNVARIGRNGTGTTTARYELSMRAIDDMIYYVGSLLRVADGADMGTQVYVRPMGVYPRDGEDWNTIQRTANLFRVTRAPSEPPRPGERREPGYYAAEVEYRGAHYMAGPANSRMCIGPACQAQPRDPDVNDVSATVLSLLTQIVIISQSEEAQLGPTNTLQTR
jgi:hypothetical protein